MRKMDEDNKLVIYIMLIIVFLIVFSVTATIIDNYINGCNCICATCGEVM